MSAESQLDNVDRLAAALAGFRAAGLGNQPFEMAKLLVAQGWCRGDVIEVTSETLFQGLVRAKKPLTWSALQNRVIGSQLGGERYARHKAEFQKLIDSGAIVSPNPDATYPTWVAVGQEL